MPTKFCSLIIMLFTSGLFAQTQVVMEDIMFMDAPYIGEVTTTTTKYASHGFFRQESSIEVDRFLVRMAMGGNKTVGSILEGKTESRVVYNNKDEEYAQESFDAIRENDGKPTLKGMSKIISFGGRSKKDNDEKDSDGEVEEDEDKSEYERTISEPLEKVSGFEARKVTTKIKSNDGMVLIEEWFTTDTTLFQFVSEVEAELVASYGGKKGNNPRSFSEAMLRRAEKKFESVPGRMVKYTMEMKNDDDGFKMVWELKFIKEVTFDSSDFEIFKKYDKVDKLD